MLRVLSCPGVRCVLLLMMVRICPTARRLVEMGSMRTLITERYKIVVDASGIGHNVLVDLENDPCEKINLWDCSETRDVKAELLARLMRESIRCTRMDNPKITPGA